MPETVIAPPVPSAPPTIGDLVFVLGRMSAEDIQFLKDISQGAPIALFQDPFLYVSNPLRPATLDEKLKTAFPPSLSMDMEVRDAVNLYNENFKRTEMIVRFHKPKDLGYDFTPYFTWVWDPAQSRASRSFLISLQNTLVASRRKFQVSLLLEKATERPVAGAHQKPELTMHAKCYNKHSQPIVPLRP